MAYPHPFSTNRHPDGSPETPPSASFHLPISPEVLLSLATAPLLFGILATRALANVFQEAGQISEELFRGDRLPILNIPVASSSEEKHD